MIDLSKVVWTSVVSVLLGSVSFITVVVGENPTASVCLGLNSIAFALLSLREN